MLLPKCLWNFFCICCYHLCSSHHLLPGWVYISYLDDVPASPPLLFPSIPFSTKQWEWPLECGSVHVTPPYLKASIISHCLWDKEWTFASWHTHMRALLGMAPSPPASSHTTCFLLLFPLYFLTGATCPPPIETFSMHSLRHEALLPSS